MWMGMILLPVWCSATGATETATPTHATGFVFHDLNNNGQRDEGEPGLPGVRVSNQVDIVQTDKAGRWRLPVTDDTTLFVIKPRNWMTPVDPVLQLPRFYYTHKPAGSPTYLLHAGCAPTGPLPRSIDFPLTQQVEPDRYEAILFGDTQSRDDLEISYLAEDIIPELMGTSAAFGVTLGDIVFDDLSIFEHHNQLVGKIGVPWYNVIGNHDHNQQSQTDVYGDETFERHYGPNYYSFDHGPVHYIALDNVDWMREDLSKRGTYEGRFGDAQLTFVRNDLALVPADQLVVLMMHIPLQVVEDREILFRMIENRPHTLSISAHAHIQGHWFFNEEQGWHGAKPHHHFVAITACGCWWGGAPDERGIPHALTSDAVPNGYTFLSIDDWRYAMRYKAASRPADWQMRISVPYELQRSQVGATDVIVNVFAGTSRSTVEMRIGDRPWQRLTQEDVEDPDFADLKALEEANPDLPGRKLPGIQKTRHTWKGRLPEGLSPGVHMIEVRTTDMFGQTFTHERLFRVR